MTLENLESRQLMAADIGVAVNQGVLKITGTDGADNVRVHADNRGRLTVFKNGVSDPVNIDLNSVRKVEANMKMGRDTFSLTSDNSRFMLQNVDIVMGSGVGDTVNVSFQGVIDRLAIDTRDAYGSVTNISANVRGDTVINTGTDEGVDYVYFKSSDLKKVIIDTGGGKDLVRLQSTQVKSMTANLGAGDDTLEANDNSSIEGGVVDGGSGTDAFYTSKNTRRIARNIEKF